MALDSPVISEPDSLIEEQLMQTGTERGTANYSTFTRKRPNNLPKLSKKKKRQSLMSPQSIPNLDSDDLLTPDFAMTQSMYEPLEKRKQQAKLDANSRLLNLMASEKSAQAAKDRKLKEIKKRSIENKKRNEEKQKLAEERRLRMIADQEEKKKRILEKINVSSPMTTSCYVNVSKNNSKYKNSITNGFMDKRPLSSTGKVFGFGSSATREVCVKLNVKKFKENDFEMKKSEQSISRMCSSQIMSYSSYAGESRLKTAKKENSASTFNISTINKGLIKNRKASSNMKIDYQNNKNKTTIPTTPEIKPIRLSNHLNGISKPFSPKPNIETNKKSRGRSAEQDKSIPNITIHLESRSRTVERKTPPVKHITTNPLAIANNNNKTIIKHNVKPNSEQVSSIKKSIGHENIMKNKNSVNSDIGISDNSKKCEVRFLEKETIKDDDHNSMMQLSTERRCTSTNNLTEDEYKQRLSLQRKLAKEKRKKEQEEKELNSSREEKNVQIIEQTDKSLFEKQVTKEISIDNSETNVDDLKSDSSYSSKKENEELMENKLKENPIVDKTTEMMDSNYETTNKIVPAIKLPKLETPVTNTVLEMTTSTEALDRQERKKRLESIMSRIKKPIGGSSENVAVHISTTTLQDMMSKGHLSGMSKTAAILMRNSQNTLTGSTSDLNYSGDPIKSTDLENLNPKVKDDSVNIEELRGSCDGQEEIISSTKISESLTTKSSLMDNLISNSNKPYLSAWQEKYSDSYSLDTEEDNAE